jgi:hypothetical protein
LPVWGPSAAGTDSVPERKLGVSRSMLMTVPS